MHKLKFYLLSCAILSLFFLNASLLNVLGWVYTDAGGGFVTKIHPAFYLLILVYILQISEGKREIWRQIFSPTYLFFLFAGFVVTIRAVFIATTGVTGGELTAAIVTWVLPAILAVALVGWSEEDYERWGLWIRLFFVANSLMALAERVVGQRFIPTYLDHNLSSLSRATALVAHPLNGALLTGLLLIVLVAARPGKMKPILRVPEIVLHIAAMFAFGGRGALVFTTAVIIFSGIVARQASGEARLTTLQRLLPYLVVLGGLMLVMLPIPFVDDTLDRFANDNGSSDTRDAAFVMLGTLDFGQIMTGIDANQRQLLMDFYGSSFGIEIAWIALIMIYGLPVTALLAAGLVLFLFMTARPLDRSAFYLMLLFLLVTAGAMSLGGKSLLISQAIVMMVTLCRRRVRLALPAPRTVEDPGPRTGPTKSSRGDRPAPTRPRSQPQPPKADGETDIPDFLR